MHNTSKELVRSFGARFQELTFPRELEYNYGKKRERKMKMKRDTAHQSFTRIDTYH